MLCPAPDSRWVQIRTGASLLLTCLLLFVFFLGVICSELALFDRMGFGSLLEETNFSVRVEETATHSMKQAELLGVVGGADNSTANGDPWLIQRIERINRSTKQSPLQLQSAQIFTRILSMQKIDSQAPAMRPLRASLFGNMSWTQHQDLVEGAGHQWCNLIRDKWACKGQRYRKVLGKTENFNKTFGLDQVPNGTNIFVHGHSHLANLVTSLICQSRASTEVWKISSVESSMNGNSLIAFSPSNNVSLLMFSNEYTTWDKLEKIQHISQYLALLNFTPHLIVLGKINGDIGATHRLFRWQQQYPLANLVPMSSHCFTSPSGMRSVGQHECYPGPGLRYVEILGSIFQETGAGENTGQIIKTLATEAWQDIRLPADTIGWQSQKTCFLTDKLLQAVGLYRH
jgi:hypothetical protein